MSPLDAGILFFISVVVGFALGVLVERRRPWRRVYPARKTEKGYEAYRPGFGGWRSVLVHDEVQGE